MEEGGWTWEREGGNGVGGLGGGLRGGGGGVMQQIRSV